MAEESKKATDHSKPTEDTKIDTDEAIKQLLGVVTNLAQKVAELETQQATQEASVSKLVPKHTTNDRLNAFREKMQIHGIESKSKAVDLPTGQTGKIKSRSVVMLVPESPLYDIYMLDGDTGEALTKEYKVTHPEAKPTPALGLVMKYLGNRRPRPNHEDVRKRKGGEKYLVAFERFGSPDGAKEGVLDWELAILGEG